MKFSKMLSAVAGLAFLALAVSYVQAIEPNDNGAQQVQTQRAPRASAQRRSYRAYSYEPSRGGDVAPRVSSPTWNRADSKVKARYGYYPY